MKLIVDTNIMYSYFWKFSVTRRLLISQEIELYAPEFALEEINKYKQDIIKKNNLSEKEFEHIKFALAIAIRFIPLEEYSGMLKAAIKICPDSNDIDFFALAMKLKIPVWSNDADLKKQDKIRIITTTELLNRPNISRILKRCV